ncbi:MAG TPA: ABC transporter ATP-binding protein [Polyangia bacterium]|nr:ABC transporter ATP-binding protein [Polyangia bacterium]
MSVVEAEHLAKTFALGFFRKKVRAVADVSFTVEKNEIFGFLGPNGAGKTTTLKMLMGLIFPSSGQARLFGKPIDDREAKHRLGFLPENPYFYDYLSGEELLDLMGRLFGLDRKERRKRARALLDRVGLGRAGAMGLSLRKYSKGMLQRLGVAQALINEPELVVLDEPMSGLDPIGRKEIRDLIVELKREGKTVLFSTHILSDVELICDRVAMMVGGRMRDVGPLQQLLSPRLLHTELVLAGGDQVEPELTKLPPDADVDAAVRDALAAGKHVVSLMPRRESLEDLFVREVDAGDTSAGAERTKKAAQ